MEYIKFGGFITWMMIPNPPTSPSQRYLGSGEDGPKKMDQTELECFGELPPGLETLCEDEEGKIYFREEAVKKKNREKVPFLPQTTPKTNPRVRCTLLLIEVMRMLKLFAALGEVFLAEKNGLLFKIRFSLGIYGCLGSSGVLGDFFFCNGFVSEWGFLGASPEKKSPFH